MPFDCAPWPPEPVRAAVPLADARRLRVRGAALVLVLAGAFAMTWLLAAGQPAADRDPELARLLHAFTAIKAVFVLALTAAVGLRLALPAGAGRALVYLGSAAAMGAGLALNAALVALGWGAVLLHAGLFGGIVLLCTDGQVAAWLQEALRKRAARQQD